MSKIELQNINKVFPNGVKAVSDFNLSIDDGEFIVLVGPSGCGKTTTLRMIAGLESISGGVLTLGEKVLNNSAPKDRDMAMVFQNYALYSHMSVYHNMAFSLTLRKENSDIIHERVLRAAKILELTPYLNRKPRALSGGQRQRVALGRAIVRDPECFLLDEPLSNLDAKLRGTMRKELVKLHGLLKTTMIYVTHDQTEAMTLGDRIVVMKDGIVQQIATPQIIYDYPVNLFVAGFIGTPPMNFIDGVIKDDGYFYFENQKIKICKAHIDGIKSSFNKPVVMGVRPENFLIDEESSVNHCDSLVMLKSEVIELLGSEILIHATLKDNKVIAKVKRNDNIKSHEDFQIAINMDRVHFFDKYTTERLNR
jgi:multiple sugar transport system ATP-binding protein